MVGRALLVLALLPPSAAAAAMQSGPVAPGVERAVEQAAQADSLWPGFKPLTVPLAVYDGQLTWLFRHPAPPSGFAPYAGMPRTAVYQGRHPAVTANSSAEIGGVATATLLADGPRGQQSPEVLAAVALHEAFHVYQREHHPGWQGNEGDLMVYPVTDSEVLALRRLESEALRRALANRDAAGAACWTRVAMGLRRERFAAMDSAFGAYDRLTELNEGLAAYIQRRATGDSVVSIPEAEFFPESVRLRAYTIGPALAQLLDRLAPGWKAALEADESQFLDTLLDAAVNGPDAPASAPCAFTPVQLGGARRDARIDAAEVIRGWEVRQRTFEAREGWRIVIQSAPERPLWPQGFDPLNIERVDGGLIHTRFLKLGNDDGSLTALDETDADIEARTAGVGPHPMFNGVAWVEIVVPAKPTVDRAGGHLAITAPGFEARFASASVVEGSKELLVQVNPAP